MDVLVSKEFTFDAAHSLKNQGKCEKLHGHTWKICVTVTGTIQKDGIAFDFVTLKDIVSRIVLHQLDHSFLNDILPQPSAENIALWLWDQLKNDLALWEIVVWENASSFITLRKDMLS